MSIALLALTCLAFSNRAHGLQSQTFLLFMSCQRVLRVLAWPMQEASRLDPGSAAIQQLLAVSRMSQGDIPDALVAFRQAIKLKPDLREAYINMASALKEVGHGSPDVLSRHRLFVTGLGRSAVPTRTLRRSQIGRVAEAEEAFRNAMALRGDGASSSHALRSIAEMRRGCGRHSEAVQLLDLERVKPSPEAYVELVFLRGLRGFIPYEQTLCEEAIR